MSDSTYDLAETIKAVNSGSPAMGSGIATLSVGNSPVVLLNYNLSRSFIVLQNLGSTLYIKLGMNASLESYSFYLDAGQMVSLDRYCGAVTAVRDGTIDNVIVTEIS